MKGQLFLIGVIVMIVALFLLKNLFSVHMFIEEQRHLESLSPSFEVNNVLRECKRISGMSKLNSDFSYLENFSIELRNQTNMNLLYILGIANETGYKIITGNFIGTNINVTLNPEKPIASSERFVLLDKAENLNNFAYSDNETITISIEYRIEQKVFRENFNLRTGSENLGAFFHVVFRDENSEISKKDVYEVLV